ncbi:MAG: tetratricopeptide repeat protein [Pseudomonadota bacterium]|nr:tetratricopeptide repeat protein [Pseudomonadota bacterium]
MSLYEHIASSSRTKKQGKNQVPNPMNAMQRDQPLQSFPWVTIIIAIQVVLFIALALYFGYVKLVKTMEFEYQNKIQALEIKQIGKDIHASQVAVDKPQSLFTDEKIKAVTKQTASPSAQTQFDNNPTKIINEEQSTFVKNLDKKVDFSNNANGSVLSRPVSSKEPVEAEEDVTSANANISNTAIKVDTSPAKIDTQPVSLPSTTEIDKTTPVDQRVSVEAVDQEVLIQKAQSLWQQGYVQKNERLLQNSVVSVKGALFSKAFADRLSLLEGQDWTSVRNFCHASSASLREDVNREQVVFACSDYWLAQKNYQQAIDMYDYQPDLKDHPDYYGRLAFLYIKNKQPKQAMEMYSKLVNQHEKNGQWWFGLGWSYHLIGKEQQAHDAYKKAYLLAVPNAVYKPLLEKILHYESH